MAPHWGPWLAAQLVKGLGKTLRVELVDPHGLLDVDQAQPYVFAFWHNRLLMMPFFYRRYLPGRKLTVMMSMSRDGQITSRMASYFNVEAARGSSSREGLKAFVTMARRLRQEGSDVGITPDGPRGPLYSVHTGILQLAEAGSVPITPVTCHYEHKWEIRSWDRFQIPKPFSKCQLVLGEPVPVKKGATAEELEEAGKRLKEVLGT
ncbi:MAG: lysophospholipid acyltransferase family protein [Blastochloris sp.]|nr:lysophospholipid acyltransferase family protein [Blastochloris sp.]